MKYASMLVAALAVVSSAPLFADGTQTPVVDKREANLEHRINQGEASGQLTNREAAHLDQRMGKLEMDEARDKADGKVTPRERRQLRREENSISRDVYRKKHNNRKKEE